MVGGCKARGLGVFDLGLDRCVQSSRVASMVQLFCPYLAPSCHGIFHRTHYYFELFASVTATSSLDCRVSAVFCSNLGFLLGHIILYRSYSDAERGETSSSSIDPSCTLNAPLSSIYFTFEVLRSLKLCYI